MRYKIKINDKSPDLPNKLIYSKNCYLGVSINNPFFWGDHLGLLLQWIDKRFPKCQIVIGDYLHRINEIMSNGRNEESAIKASLSLGDKMYERINGNLERMTNNIFTVHRWQDYINDLDTLDKLHKIFSLFNSNQGFHDGIQQSCKEFIARQIKQGKKLGVSKEKALELSSKYLLEELAVFSTLIEKDYTVQVYPGTQLLILKQLANGEIIEVDTNLKKGIFLDLTVKKIGK